MILGLIGFSGVVFHKVFHEVAATCQMESVQDNSLTLLLADAVAWELNWAYRLQSYNWLFIFRVTSLSWIVQGSPNFITETPIF